MKVSPASLQSFCDKPPASVRVVLVYGPNEGLARERVRTLAHAIIGQPADPFRMSEVASQSLARDLGAFFEHVEARSLTGKRCVLVITEADDRLTKHLVKVVSETKSDTFLILQAGALDSRSSLRKICEQQAHYAAVACYADEGASLKTVVVDHLSALDLQPSPDALAWLVESLGSDRGILRQELDKLALYVGASGRTVMDLEDVHLCVGDSSILAAEDLAVHVADGHVSASQAALARLLNEGMTGVALLRTVTRYFQRLHLVAGALRRGDDVASALALLKPPVFWKVRDAFVRQAKTWSVGRLGHALNILLTAEVDCKSTSLSEHIVVSRAFLRLASGASTATQFRHPSLS